MCSTETARYVPTNFVEPILGTINMSTVVENDASRMFGLLQQEPYVHVPIAAIFWNAVVNREWRIAAMGGKYRVRPVRKPGGFGWEACHQATALGFETIVATARGPDKLGDFLDVALRATGADTTELRMTSQPTATADVIVCGDLRTVLIDDETPTACWHASSEDARIISGADLVLAGGSLPDDDLQSIIRHATALGKPVFTNPTRIRRLDQFKMDNVLLVQISPDDFPNFGFATTAPPEIAAQTFLRAGAEAVVVTDSANGEWAFTGNGFLRMPAIPVQRPQFPVGCGDAAFVGHVAGIVRCNYNVEGLIDWVALGTNAGAFFVEHGFPGGWAEIACVGRDKTAVTVET